MSSKKSLGQRRFNHTVVWDRKLFRYRPGIMVRGKHLPKGRIVMVSDTQTYETIHEAMHHSAEISFIESVWFADRIRGYFPETNTVRAAEILRSTPPSRKFG